MKQQLSASLHSSIPGLGWKGRLLMAMWLAFASAHANAETAGSLGSLEVSSEELRSSLAGLDAGQLESVRQEPALLEQVVRTLLVQRLVLREATALNWQEKPEIKAKLTRARDSTLTESYLESVALPPPSYPNESEIKAAYESSRETFRQPRSFRLAQIFISAGPEATEKLAEVRTLLKKSPNDFAAIARKHSQETVSAARDGEIGWVAEPQVEPDLRSHLTGLKLFGISEPVQLKDGWHILKLLDAREPYVPTLSQVQPQLVKQLRQEKLRLNTQAYLAKLLKEHPLVLNESVIRRLLPEAAR